jgi:hypothetical protein
VKDVARRLGKGGKTLGKAIGKGGKTIGNALGKGGQAIGRTSVRVGKGVGRGFAHTGRAVARVTVTAVKGVRYAGAFAVRMVIPPLTPGSLLVELVLAAAFALYEHWVAEKERENFERQLKRLPEMIDRQLKRRREAGAKLLVRNFEAGGAGFVYARVFADVIKRERATMRPGFYFRVSEEWDIELMHLRFSTGLAKPRRMLADSTKRETDPKTYTTTVTEETRTRLEFTIEEPVFTPFDYFLGALETLDQLLYQLRAEQIQIEGGVGPVAEGVGEQFSERHLLRARGWIRRLNGLFAHHRDMEERIGTSRARAIRKLMLGQGEQVTRRIVHAVVATLPVEALEPNSLFFEAHGLALQIQADFRRARRTRHDGYYYRRSEGVKDKTGGASFWKLVGWKWVN